MSTPILFIDFETRSACDIKSAGAEVYAAHPTTDVLCMGYAFDKAAPKLWVSGEPFPYEVIDHIDSQRPVVAHNAGFEFWIWNQCLKKRSVVISLQLEQLYCTMSMSTAMGLPGSLDMASKAAGIQHEKDAAGHRLMLQLSQPRTEVDGKIVWWDQAEFKDKYDRLFAYCLQDVRVEQALFYRLSPLSAKERKIWMMDQTINQRGVKIEAKEVNIAIDLVKGEQDRLNSRLREITHNQVATHNANAQFKLWMKRLGYEADSIAKAEVTEMLKDENIPPVIKEALLIRQEAAKSSTAKLVAMDASIGQDWRARGLFFYHGASTGRWAGRRIQLQNLPRSKIKFHQVEDAIQLMNTEDGRDAIELLYGSPMTIVSDCLRSFIVSDYRKKFICADFSSIEARGLAWLAGEQTILDIFKGDGKIYEYAASGIYRKPIGEISADERQIGKVAILALGYGGGVGAFQTMAKGYGIKITDEEAEKIKVAWRKANPNITNYWGDLESAAKDAIENKGAVFEAGAEGAEVKFKKMGSFLACRLPSGRLMYYPYARIGKQAWVTFIGVKKSFSFWGLDESEVRFKIEKFSKQNGIEPDFKTKSPWFQDIVVYKAQDSTTKQWAWCATYGGSLAENITQAISRDILAEAMLRLEAHGYPIVIHVHDEVVAEVPINDTKFSLQHFERVMSEVPLWANGFPIQAKGWEGFRYRKA